MAIIHFPHPVKSYLKVHRLVVLPDYQGIGIGKLFLNWYGEIAEKPFAITTSQPQLIAALKKADNWVCSRIGRLVNHSGMKMQSLNKSISSKRITATFVYKGKNNE